MRPGTDSVRGTRHHCDSWARKHNYYEQKDGDGAPMPLSLHRYIFGCDRTLVIASNVIGNSYGQT